MTMKIEIISIPNCPNHEPTVERVKSVLNTASISANVVERLVSNETEAGAVGFAGSPTVRINGTDIEPAANTTTNLSCRIYAGGCGVPSVELVENAIKEARRGEGTHESC